MKIARLVIFPVYNMMIAGVKSSAMVLQFLKYNYRRINFFLMNFKDRESVCPSVVFFLYKFHYLYNCMSNHFQARMGEGRRVGKGVEAAYKTTQKNTTVF